MFSTRVTVTHCDVDAQKPFWLIGFIFGHSVPKTLSLLSQLVPLPPLKLPNSQFRQLCPTSPLGTSDDPEVSKSPHTHTHTLPFPECQTGQRFFLPGLHGQFIFAHLFRAPRGPQSPTSAVSGNPTSGFLYYASTISLQFLHLYNTFATHINWGNGNNIFLY